MTDKIERDGFVGIVVADPESDTKLSVFRLRLPAMRRPEGFSLRDMMKMKTGVDFGQPEVADRFLRNSILRLLDSADDKQACARQVATLVPVLTETHGPFVSVRARLSGRLITVESVQSINAETMQSAEAAFDEAVEASRVVITTRH